jgi:hypothetical protein
MGGGGRWEGQISLTIDDIHAKTLFSFFLCQERYQDEDADSQRQRQLRAPNDPNDPPSDPPAMRAVHNPNMPNSNTRPTKSGHTTTEQALATAGSGSAAAAAANNANAIDSGNKNSTQTSSAGMSTNITRGDGSRPSLLDVVDVFSIN